MLEFGRHGISIRSIEEDLGATPGHSFGICPMVSSERHGQPCPAPFGLRLRSGSGRSWIAGHCRCSHGSGRCGRPRCSSVSAGSYLHGLLPLCYVHGLTAGAPGGGSSRLAIACSAALWALIRWSITSAVLSSIAMASPGSVCRCRRLSKTGVFIFSFLRRGSAWMTIRLSGGHFCSQRLTAYTAATGGDLLSPMMRSFGEPWPRRSKKLRWATPVQLGLWTLFGRVVLRLQHLRLHRPDLLDCHLLSRPLLVLRSLSLLSSSSPP